VEDEIGSVLSRAFCAGKCTLHASGREDVDVRTIGTGRPFVMELASPKKRSADLAAIEAEMEGNRNVRAVGLRIVPKHFVDAVCNSHFEKEYSALVCADRPLTAADASKAEKLSGALLFQQTPNRVLSRRTDMCRRRRIFRISASALPGGKLRLSILAEAGTYIKEFISGDGGRTKPSLSSVLSCNASCEELDVVRIYDYFLQTLGEAAIGKPDAASAPRPLL
jgi:tRNA pseudouridine synthase 10